MADMKKTSIHLALAPATGLVFLTLASGPGRSAPPGEVRFTVDSGKQVRPISPYVYGTNQPEWTKGSRTLTLTRLGGNRWTAYNWETNASNAGNDWRHQNDDFLGGGEEPGGAVRPAVAAALKAGAAMIVTVPCAGYVSADKDPPEDVNRTPDYLNKRFFSSLPRKGAPFTLPPDRNDRKVYQDEFVYWLRKTFPDAGKRGTPPLFYSLDNEPDLWSETHKRIHPEKLTYAEMVRRSVDYASGIKGADPSGLIFGPASYGWHGYDTLQDAPDAAGRDFLEFYLDRMRAAETRTGKRLLDVLDVHYYSEAQGDGKRVTEGVTTPAAVAARVQATRSLWDPAYTEESWITKYSSKGPIRLVPRLREKIAKHYPGTKLALTEYNFGAAGHISGAVAEADALGIFGREGVFAACWWDLGKGRDFADAAFAMYRNYDGANGSFGDTSVSAETSDIARASAYASVDRGKPDRMVLTAINRSLQPLTASVSVTHPSRFGKAEVYRLTEAAAASKRYTDLRVASNAFRCPLPAMSVTTLVLRR